jgi:hypothetical protein
MVFVLPLFFSFRQPVESVRGTISRESTKAMTLSIICLLGNSWRGGVCGSCILEKQVRIPALYPGNKVSDPLILKFFQHKTDFITKLKFSDKEFKKSRLCLFFCFFIYTNYNLASPYLPRLDLSDYTSFGRIVKVQGGKEKPKKEDEVNNATTTFRKVPF